MKKLVFYDLTEFVCKSLRTHSQHIILVLSYFDNIRRQKLLLFLNLLEEFKDNILATFLYKNFLYDIETHSGLYNANII